MRLVAVAIIMAFSLYLSFIRGREARLARRLCESEERFRGLVDALPETIFEMDSSGRITFANSRALELFGYSEADLEAGLTALRMVVPEDRAHAGRNIVRTLRGEVPGDNEFTAMRKDGSTFPIHIYSSPILKEGRSAGVRGIVVDETRRREREETIRRLSLAVEQSPVSVVITNPSGRIEYVNPEFTRITGYTVEEAVGKNPRILKSGLTPPGRYREMWEAITAGEPWRGILVNRKKNGDIYWEDVRIAPIRDASGETRSYIGVKEDITERHLLEEKVRSSEKTLRAILDNMQDTYYRTDPDGRIIMASPSAKSLLGYEIDELIGKNLADLYVDPSQRRVILDRLAGAEGSLRDVESELRRKDGSIITVWTNARFYHDEEGNVLGVEGTTRDVTERKKTAEKLAAYARDVETADRVKALYIDIMSHDLLNPVNVILNATDLVSPYVPEGSPREFCAMIEESALEIEEMIDLVKKYSRITSLRELEFNPTDLDGLIGDVLKKFHLLLEKRRMEVHHVKGAGSPVPANELIYEVVANLLSNAIKYGPEGGEIRIGTAEAGEGMILFVADRGAGIPDEEKEKIFGRFERLEKGSIQGTGLGLAICKGVVELHGGRIWVEDNPGGGSLFKVLLPLRGGPPAGETGA